jgi:hypothetical protein
VRIAAWAYSLLLTLSAGWAWWIDVSLKNVPHEQLLPDIVLAFLTLPSSLALEYVYSANPVFFGRPFIQLALLTACAILQASFFLWLSVRLSRNGSAAGAA